MRILVIISGDYGLRDIDNIRAHGPDTWTIDVWRAPRVLPQVIDYPEDYLPDELPPADLIISFGEIKGVAELLPDIAEMTGAQAVIAPIDNEARLPRGLARQLRGWLANMNVAIATPKPLCMLTETSYQVARRTTMEVMHPLIAEFARYFGKPAFDVTVDQATRKITGVEVRRDASCGCARYVAERLVGVSADDAGEQAGLLRHHFPCMASMGIDSDYGDTLMHVSGNVLKDEVEAQVKPYKRERRITPDGFVAPGADEG